VDVFWPFSGRFMVVLWRFLEFYGPEKAKKDRKNPVKTREKTVEKPVEKYS